MIVAISLIPATILVVVGYFVLFSATRTGGAMKTFGQALATWLFILAAAFPVAGGYATYAGFPSMDAMMGSMHPGTSPK